MKSKSVTIQMKATEQYFPVILFVMLYKVVLIFKPRRWMKSFSVILLIESCKVVFALVQFFFSVK